MTTTTQALRLVPAVPRRQQARYPIIVISWRVMGPDGGMLGWVDLAYIRTTGQASWRVFDRYGEYIPVRSAGRRRGRDAVGALLIHHGILEGAHS